MLRALAYPEMHVDRLDAPIYSQRSRRSRVIGHVRRGTWVKVGAAASKRGCRRGHWHPVVGGGYICSAGTYRVGPDTVARGELQSPPDASRALPYRYVKASTNQARLLSRLPTEAEAVALDRAMSGKGRFPSIVTRKLDGVFFLAIDSEFQVGDHDFLRTVQGYFIRQQDVRPLKPTRLRAEHLRGEHRLPVAFVNATEAPVLSPDGTSPKESIQLERYDRFHVARRIQKGGLDLVVDEDGRAVARRHVRLLTRIERPKGVPEGARWIHIDLAEQGLVAYEGDVPVFATLISAGRKGHRTPAGLYRIQRKHLTVTMRGYDPVDKWYRVEEVPWTMYYFDSYAIHGAYWHDSFGNVRSHGCTNIAPPDARWLYHFTRPRIPDRWHARLQVKGSHIYFTR